MTAHQARQQLKMTQHDFAASVIAWLEELQLRPSRVLVLEEKVSPARLAQCWDIDQTTATRIIRSVSGSRKLSRKCLRAPASALETFFRTKTLPKRKAKA